MRWRLRSAKNILLAKGNLWVDWSTGIRSETWCHCHFFMCCPRICLHHSRFVALCHKNRCLVCDRYVCRADVYHFIIVFLLWIMAWSCYGDCNWTDFVTSLYQTEGKNEICHQIIQRGCNIAYGHATATIRADVNGSIRNHRHRFRRLLCSCHYLSWNVQQRSLPVRAKRTHQIHILAKFLCLLLVRSVYCWVSTFCYSFNGFAMVFYAQ